MDDVISNFDLVLQAFRLTIELFVVSGILSLIFGTALAAMRVGPVAVLARAAALYVALVRNTPLLIVFILATFGLPKLDVQLPFFVKGVIALTVYTSAFVCEAVRSIHRATRGASRPNEVPPFLRFSVVIPLSPPSPLPPDLG